MSTRNLLVSVCLALAFGSAAVAQEGPKLGKPITEADVGAWNLDVLPDGTGLPAGSGTPAQGAPIYAQKCAVCHGEKGEKPAPGYGPMIGLHEFKTIDAPKTVTYYRYATTLFDVIRRSMPNAIKKRLGGSYSSRTRRVNSVESSRATCFEGSPLIAGRGGRLAFASSR